MAWLLEITAAGEMLSMLSRWPLNEPPPLLMLSVAVRLAWP